MSQRLIVLLCIGLIVSFSGCATLPSFYVRIDSISNGDEVSGKKFIILPGNKDTATGDLQFKEYSSYVKRAFESKGYNVVEDFQESDVVVFLNYGISDPDEHSYTYSVPVWGQTGYSSATTTGSAYSYGNSASYSGFTTYTPSYGVVGSNTYSGSYVSYSRYLVLDAYDSIVYRDSEKEVQLWKTTITSIGSSGDLRRVFPVLIAAAKPYIGENTGKKIGIDLKENDERVLEIKGIQKKENKGPHD